MKGLLREQSVLAGVGNAYSDEALHAARLSPYAVAGKLEDEQVARLHGPIGLNLGGRQPAETALAILAEMRAVRCGGGAEWLSQQ